MSPDEKKAKAVDAKARKDAELMASISAPRAGWNPDPRRAPAMIPDKALSGIELSDLVEKKLDWFRPDPENAEFETLKDNQPGYWQNLRRDIEQVGILTPLVTTHDGLIVQGHSRLRVARELNMERLPVLLILSPLIEDEIRKRRRLDNLLRFEVDTDTRLSMLAEVWPEFFLCEKKPGRPEGNTDTVSELNARVIAQTLGASERQVERDRATIRRAATIAKEVGKPRPGVADIKAARDMENARRREEATKPKSQTVALQRQPSNAEEVHLMEAVGHLRRCYIDGAEDYRKGLNDALTVLNRFQVIPRETFQVLSTVMDDRGAFL